MLEHHSDNPQKEALFQKLEKLPVQLIPEVDLFIDFVRLRYNGEKKLVEDYMRLSAEVWDDD